MISTRQHQALQFIRTPDAQKKEQILQQMTITKSSLPTGWCETRVRSGDTLASLAARFLPALSIDDAAKKIATVNGVVWSTPAINEWVIATGGVWLKQAPGGGTVTGSPTGGWAAFSASSQIILPCVEASPNKTCACDEGGFPWLVLLGGALTGAGAMAALKSKKKGR